MSISEMKAIKNFILEFHPKITHENSIYGLSLPELMEIVKQIAMEYLGE